MNNSVAIIGAGLSGLSCARALSAAGIPVTIFEKSRSLGGRCATRRWEGHVVDHGAQYFTIRDRRFAAELEDLCPGKIVALEAPVIDAQECPVDVSTTRYYHLEGNNRIGKALLGSLPVRMETLIESVKPVGDAWQVGDELFAAVVSCAPGPQTARLLGDSTSPVEYDPCLTAFFAYPGRWAGNSAEAYARKGEPDDPLMWSACENHKTGRVTGDATVFVAQASPAFSREWMEEDPLQWAAPLRKTLEERWQLRPGICAATFTHRWRYARVTSKAPAPRLPAGFYLTGDGITESRVESAWQAGRLTAARILLSPVAAC